MAGGPALPATVPTSAAIFDRIARVRVDLYGSLAKTGRGHGTDIAVLLGLAGEDPVTCDPARIHAKVAALGRSGEIPWAACRPIPFDFEADLAFHAASPCRSTPTA